MKPKKEAVDQYRQMVQDLLENDKDIIREHLRENCPKFDEAHFDGCMEYLQETVLELLGGRESARKGKLSGAVHADVVFKICRDYFDDELWKIEQESDKERKAAVSEAIDAAKSDEAADTTPSENPAPAAPVNPRASVSGKNKPEKPKENKKLLRMINACGGDRVYPSFF